MPRLRRREASAYLRECHGISRTPATLAKLACTGAGPRFRRDGRVPLYDIADLDAYAQATLTPAASSTAAHDEHARRHVREEAIA